MYFLLFTFNRTGIPHLRRVSCGLWCSGGGGLFFVLPHLSDLSIYDCSAFSLVFGSMRWILIGIYPDWPWLLVGLQLLHAFTFGAIHSVSIEFMRRWSLGSYQAAEWPSTADSFWSRRFSGCYFIWDYVGSAAVA